MCGASQHDTPSNILHTPPNILCTPSKILCTPSASNILLSLSNILHTPPKIIRKSYLWCPGHPIGKALASGHGELWSRTPLPYEELEGYIEYLGRYVEY